MLARIGAPLGIAAAAAALAGYASAPISAKPLLRQTKAQAEVTLLRANRSLLQLDRRLVDPRTHLVRTNTRVLCHGQGRPQGGTFLRFRCVIGNGKAKFLVSYVAFGQNGRVLRKLATLRAA